MRIRKGHSSERGFTLIELIIVMAIIGILVGATASTFQTSRIKGKDSKRKGELKQVQNSLEAYSADHDLYPLAGAGNTIAACGGSGTAVCAWGSSFTDQNGTIYMPQLPSDLNAPTIQYQYFVSSDRKKYQLYTHLENQYDKDIIVYGSKGCSDTTANVCNYGISSLNATPSDTLP